MGKQCKFGWRDAFGTKHSCNRRSDMEGVKLKHLPKHKVGSLKKILVWPADTTATEQVVCSVRAHTSWMKRCYEKAGCASQWGETKVENFCVCVEHFPAESFVGQDLRYGAVPELPIQPPEHAAPTQTEPLTPLQPSPTRVLRRTVTPSPQSTIKSRPERGGAGRKRQASTSADFVVPAASASVSASSSVADSSKKKKRRKKDSGGLNDDRPPALLDIDRLRSDMPPKALKSLLGFSSWAGVMALYDLLDWCGDLSGDNFVLYDYTRTSAFRFEEGTLGRAKEPDGAAKEPRAPKPAADASATTSLNPDFVPEPSGAQQATPMLDRGEPRRTAAKGRSGPAHKHGALRSYLFTLIALFSGVTIHVAAALMSVDHSKSSAIFTTFVMFMYRSLLVDQAPENVSSGRSQSRMPKHWVNVLKTNKVKVIIDATEFTVQGTSVLSRARSHWSSYKSNYTIKFLVGITAHGTIVFVSEGYPGKITDFQITEVCGLLDFIERGDLALADRGFNIAQLLAKHEAGLLVGHTHAHGAKEKTAGKYSLDQLNTMQRYSNLRIHVERAMASIKRMRFLQKTLRHEHKHLVTPIVSISAMLSNMGFPLLNREDAQRIWTV